MAKYKVVQGFIDRYTMSVVNEGEVIDITEERLAEIMEAAPYVIEAVEEEKIETVEEDKPATPKKRTAAKAEAEE